MMRSLFKVLLAGAAITLTTSPLSARADDDRCARVEKSLKRAIANATLVDAWWRAYERHNNNDRSDYFVVWDIKREGTGSNNAAICSALVKYNSDPELAMRMLDPNNRLTAEEIAEIRGGDPSIEVDGGANLARWGLWWGESGVRIKYTVTLRPDLEPHYLFWIEVQPFGLGSTRG